LIIQSPFADTPSRIVRSQPHPLLGRAILFSAVSVALVRFAKAAALFPAGLAPAMVHLYFRILTRFASASQVCMTLNGWSEGARAAV
jgi:hypothetical protein